MDKLSKFSKFFKLSTAIFTIGMCSFYRLSIFIKF